MKEMRFHILFQKNLSQNHKVGFQMELSVVTCACEDTRKRQTWISIWNIDAERNLPFPVRFVKFGQFGSPILKSI